MTSANPAVRPPPAGARIGWARRCRSLLGASVLVGALAATGCAGDLGSEDGPVGDEAEAPVQAGDAGEGLSLGELREMVEDRARDSGMSSYRIDCVLDYLDETFDEGTAGDEASLAIDEAFGACAIGDAPDVPLEPTVPQPGG